MSTNRKIHNILSKLTSEIIAEGWKPKDVNAKLKSRLSEEFRDLKDEYTYMPNSSDEKESSHKEWLYDLTIRRYKNGRFVGVEIAAEFELSSTCEGGIRRDFFKLLQADAANKLFIYKHDERDSLKNLGSIMRDSANVYENDYPPEKLIIASWSTTDQCFTFY
ncbi:hypothetical protein [Parendozoicomonas haliclonae]|uniref:Uncharacterized protein n=1 Tax=Parendozoicomonas haliclonae TaxID=1960125 RepID=A0A1X7AF31_9GAMM|nr:hypothetical protein [Parendozoicomonas haliclonae]SMA34733.1 hypothetical protein EHSB41UT_00442 [Parendozoicomonas haliclonae]